MTKDQIEEVCELYIDKITDCNLSKDQDHIIWMLNEIQQEEDSDKVNRWLGFVQGVLWSEELYTIDEMREHNRKRVAESE